MGSAGWGQAVGVACRYRPRKVTVRNSRLRRWVGCAAAVALTVSACAGEGTEPPSTAAATTTSASTTIASTVPVTTEGTLATTSTTTTAAPTPTAPATTTTTLPPVVGPEPSPRVVAFYYPWYGNPDFDNGWVHWDQAGSYPPLNISSDYYPVLGAYSAIDPAVVAQHMSWLREAGVGVIASSWWGRDSNVDRALPLILDMAERYGIEVAFHIEPYGTRSALSVFTDIVYLYDSYGGHPAFFRSTDRSRWSDDDRAKGLFFIWSSEQPHAGLEYVQPEYWRDAVDRVHELEDGGLVIADNPNGAWIDAGHFDGLYQYVTLEQNPDFGWARTLPPDAWYIPSVLPGFSARQIGYDTSTFTPRNGGETYRNQWAAALDTGIEPKMVTITSFNEWHEGTQIEPAARGAERSNGDRYVRYAGLGERGYLDLTAELAAVYLATDWPPFYAFRVRLRVTTTSDWTTVTLVEGGELVQPVLVSMSNAGWHQFEGSGGNRLAVFQSIEDAEAGKTVELLLDVGVYDPGDTITIRIERGGLGWTEVGIGAGDKETVVENWSGWSDAVVDGEQGRNPYVFTFTTADVSD